MRAASLACVLSTMLTGCGSRNIDERQDDASTQEPALELVISGPSARSGRAGDVLADDCAVLLTRGGAPVVDVQVTFEVMSGGGGVAPSFALTAADGTASTRWQLGFGGSGQRLRASVEGATPVEFTADATVRPIEFRPVVESAAGQTPWGLAVGDFDAVPGKDLVIGLRTPKRLVVLKNGNNTGSFVDATLGPLLVDQPRGLVVARLDGDGLDDVVVAVENLNGVVSVLHGAATGILGNQVDLANAGDLPWDVALADLDGNSTRDVVVSSHGDSTITVFPSVDPAAQPVKFAISLGSTMNTDPRGIAIGDLDGVEGLEATEFADIVVALRQGDYLATGDQSFGRLLGGTGFAFGSVQNYQTGKFPTDIALADLDGDRNLDVVTANQSTSPATLGLAKGLGSGQFLPAVPFDLPFPPEQIAVADLNGDARPEIVVTQPNGKNILVLVNNGAGSFTSLPPLAAGTAGTEQPVNVIVADVNADGLPDIVTANESTNNVGVLLLK